MIGDAIGGKKKEEELVPGTTDEQGRPTLTAPAVDGFRVVNE
jgi:hypothetical protein